MIYISLVNEQNTNNGHLCHLLTLTGCNFGLKPQKLIILFLIESSICQLSESVEKTDFWVHIKKLFYFKWNWIFNFYENYFLFGSDFASRYQKWLKNSLKPSSTSNQLESKFFSKNIYIFLKYWYFENLNFFILELVFFLNNSRIREN